MNVAYAVYSAVHATKAAQEAGAALPNEIFDKYFKTFTMAPDPAVPFETADSYKKAKQQARSIIFCTFKEPNDTERLGKKIEKYTGIALDIDNKADEIPDDETAPAHITRHELFDKYSDLEYIFYTTFSHNQPVPCKDGSTLKPREKFRIVFFYDRPATIEEHVQIYEYLKSRLSCPPYSDDQMKTQALSLSLPMCRVSRRNDAESLYHKGQRLNVDEICRKIGGREECVLQIEFVDNKQQRGLQNVSSVSINNINDSDVNHKNEKSLKNILKIDQDFSNFANNISNAVKILSMIECKNVAYKDWLEILGACKSTGVPWEIFDGWCRTDMARYDYNDNRKKWDEDKYRAGIAGFIEVARRLGINVMFNHAKNDLLFTKDDLEDFDEDFDDFEYCLPQKFIDEAPDLIHMIMEHTESCAYDVVKEVSFAGAIATIAGLSHKRLMTEDYVCPNLLTLAIAESGAGKDATTNVMQAILSEDLNGAYCTMSPAESKGGFIDEMIHTGGNWMYIATEAKGMLFDKFDKTNRASHLKGFEEEFTSMFDRSRTQHDGHGKTKSQEQNQFDITPQKLKKNPVYMPHFSFFGTTTPDVLPIFNTNSGTNGLLGRFFVVHGPKTPQPGIYKPNINRFHMFPDELRRQLYQYIKLRVADGKRDLPDVVRYEPGVLEYAHIRKEGIKDLQRKLLIGDDDRLGQSVLSRININAKKIAMVCTPLGDVITRRRLEWAYDLLIESQTRVRKAISALDEKKKAKKYEPLYDRVRKAVGELCERKATVSVRDVQRKLNMSSAEDGTQIRKALDYLVLHKVIQVYKDYNTIAYKPVRRR